jgi:diguanylate cyclase
LPAGDDFANLRRHLRGGRHAIMLISHRHSFAFIHVPKTAGSSVAFALKPGQVSPVVKLGDSYYVLLVEAKKNASVKPMSDVRDEIEKNLIQQERMKTQQRWLDTLARFDPEGHSRIAALDTLSDKLEYALMRFAQAARAAQSETSDHRGAIGVHLEAMNAPEGLEQVLDLSRAMLARLEEVEAAMAKSHAETEQLRDSLAKARIEADVDHLTRLPNRRAFERRLVSAALEAQRRGEPLSLAFCDVDHFKQINDRHGHAAGDRVLCALAATLAEGAGEACFVARHGGEEFVLLFHGLAKEAARGRLDAVRRAQGARVLMNRDTGEPFGKITFSAGIAEVTENADIRSALARADAALYRAKQQGRNRVELG